MAQPKLKTNSKTSSHAVSDGLTANAWICLWLMLGASVGIVWDALWVGLWHALKTSDNPTVIWILLLPIMMAGVAGIHVFFLLVVELTEPETRRQAEFLLASFGFIWVFCVALMVMIWQDWERFFGILNLLFMLGYTVRYSAKSLGACRLLWDNPMHTKAHGAN